MNNQKEWKNYISEGIFFLIVGGALFFYSLTSYHSSFTKEWSQSPYLFPILISVIFTALSMSLLYMGAKGRKSVVSNTKEQEAGEKAKGQLLPVLIVLGISALYYVSLSIIKIPYITFGFFDKYSLTISTFEVMTVVYLIAMMIYLGVKKLAVLITLPIAVTLFLSIAFRALLHVLLP